MTSGAAAKPFTPGLLYRILVAAVAILGLFTFASDYLWNSGRIPWPPIYLILLTAVMAAPLAASSSFRRSALSSPLLLWCSVYVSVTIFWFLVLSRQSDVSEQEMLTRFLAVIVLVTMIVIFSDSRVHRPVRLVLTVATLLAVATNFYEVLNPQTFSKDMGRSAGLYNNPTISGSALVLSLIITYQIVPRELRGWYVVVVGGGVVSTLTRGAILGWVVVVALMIVMREVRLRAVLIPTAVLALAALVIVSVTDRPRQLLEAIPAGAKQPWGRLAVGSAAGLEQDESIAVRVQVAETAWRMFGERPLLGHGIGATSEWTESVSTHNIYLRQLVEYGVMGVLLFPMLVLSAVWRAGRAERAMAIMFAAFLLLWGLFSHNLLDERNFLIAIALVACMVQAGRRQIA